MAIVQCGNRTCNRQYNKVLPVCPYCGSSTDSSIIVDEDISLHDFTGGDNFKIIHRLGNPLGSDITIFQRNSEEYGVAQSIQDIPKGHYERFSYIGDVVSEKYLKVMKKNENGEEKYGIIDIYGNYIINVEYDNIWNITPQYINWTRIEKNGEYFIVDLEEISVTGEIKVLKSGRVVNKPRPRSCSIVTGSADSLFQILL
ncbi:MAG: WG repeat-containing protein [Bacteroidales bacterium]|nr:WG repeat-containing protein [Bacteroidales bacterium]